MPGTRLLGWQQMKIAKDLVSGVSTKELAEEWDITESTVNRVKLRQRDLIEAESRKYIEALPDAVQIQCSLIKAVKDDFENNNGLGTLSEQNPELFKAGVKASENAMKSVGILQGQNISFSVKNIYEDNRTQVLSPIVQDVLAKMFNSPSNTQVSNSNTQVSKPLEGKNE